MKLTMLGGKGGKYPKLKGKAAEIKHLTPIVYTMWCEGMVAGDEAHVKIKLALQFSGEVDKMLDDHPRDYALPARVAQAFQLKTLQYVQLQAVLQNLNGLQVFSVTIKHHYLVHAAIRAGHLSPRVGWCFMGEDYMSKVKRLIASCLAGNAHEKVSMKVAQKLAHALHFVLTREHLRA